MFYAFGFERIGVVVGDLYFVNPDPEEGQEGAEQGVRLELRRIERGGLPGSVYSAAPIAIGLPLWRADLLESVDRPGTLDRAHHHPRFDGWEPGPRRFVEAMTADPLAWVGGRLAALDDLLAEAGVPAGDPAPSDAAPLAAAVPEILAAANVLLELVRRAAGDRPEPAPDHGGIRIGWL